eukprot:Plantae.Rhodophyta-Purpureofilum_apyrenoidigerum.ctg13125.p1 GENE.Plantae.Rhodophyta-Purpureofilum_apyrenoidigerum.ctg13125~~Plantae.Rhodophyta-Purpureofilum_apyrenoidigerum.ctg13125.p1  ORF type:complete len:724 (+),score=154.01 Plantae.Rhodophyta-Purpureofilum_apyrenoidigerum.ctg13125:103-2274(+)
MMTRTLKEVLQGTKTAKLVKQGSSGYELAQYLLENRVEAACVGHGRTLKGIVTVRDVVKLLARREDLDLIVVADFMTTEPVILPGDATTVDAIAVMRAGGFRHVPVVGDRSEYLGIVDALELVYDAIAFIQQKVIPTRRAFWFFRSTAEKLNEPSLLTIATEKDDAVLLTSDEILLHACDMMTSREQTAVAITDLDGFLEGIVTSRDVLKAVASREKPLESVVLADVMTRNPDFASTTDTLLTALEKMRDREFRHLPVIDESYRVVSLVNVLQVAGDALLQTAGQSSPAESSQGFWSYLFSSTSQIPQEPVRTKRSNENSILPASETIVFKFKDKSGDYRRVLVPRKTSRGMYDRFLIDVRKRFGAGSMSILKIKYFDDEGDTVRIASDEDFNECITAAIENEWKTIRALVEEVAAEPPSSTSRANLVETMSVNSAAESNKDDSESTSQTEGGLHDKIEQAMEFLRKNQVEEAKSSYEQAISMDNSSARAYCGKAATELILRNPEQALNDYKKAICLAEEQNTDKDSLANFRDMCNSGIAEALIEMRRYEEAGTVLSSINNSAARNEITQAYLEELSACVESAEKALEASAPMEACDLYTGAIRVDTVLAKEIGRPRDAKLHVQRAKCYVAIGDQEVALEDYQLALEHNPESKTALIGRANCLVDLDRPKEAKIAYELCLQLYPDDEAAKGGLEKVRETVLAEEKQKIANLGSMLRGIVPPKK